MGKASRRKRERRQADEPGILGNLPPELRDLPVATNHGRPKISGALVDLLDPYVEDEMDLQAHRRLVDLGVIAWNLAITKKGPAEEEVRSFIEQVDMDVPDSELFAQFLVEVIERKRALFPDDERLIAAWDVEVRPNGQHRVLAAGVHTG